MSCSSCDACFPDAQCQCLAFDFFLLFFCFELMTFFPLPPERGEQKFHFPNLIFPRRSASKRETEKKSFDPFPSPLIHPISLSFSLFLYPSLSCSAKSQPHVPSATVSRFAPSEWRWNKPSPQALQDPQGGPRGAVGGD